MNILALDIATTTGWALAENGRLNWGHVDFAPRRGESPGSRPLRFGRWLEDMVMRDGPVKRVGLVAFERAHHRGGAATHVCVGLMSEAERVCAALGIEHIAVTTSELKRFATGKGGANKDGMKLAASRIVGIGDRVSEEWARFMDSVTDDEADALCVLSWAQSQVPR